MDLYGGTNGEGNLSQYFNLVANSDLEMMNLSLGARRGLGTYFNFSHQGREHCVPLQVPLLRLILQVGDLGECVKFVIP